MNHEIHQFLQISGAIPLEQFENIDRALSRVSRELGVTITWFGISPGTFASYRRQQIDFMRFQALVLIEDETAKEGQKFLPRAIGELFRRIPLDLTAPEIAKTLRLDARSTEDDIERALKLVGRSGDMERLRTEARKQFPPPALDKEFGFPTPQAAKHRFEAHFRHVYELKKLRQKWVTQRFKDVFGEQQQNATTPTGKEEDADQ